MPPKELQGETTQAIVQQSGPDPRLLLMPVMNIALAKQRLIEFQTFIKDYLVEGEDFGTIPGTNKPTLYKPGADKLCEIYGLADTYPSDRIIRNERWELEPPLFDYEVTCVLIHKQTQTVVAEGMGSCNSYEGRYKWRDAQRRCPQCGKPTIIKGKEEYGGGWICFAKKGGCGAKFADGDIAITAQETGRVPNDDIATLKNTILKMAKKRAKIDATLSATRSSGVFTQDVEDMQGAIDSPPAPKVDAETISGIIRSQEEDKNSEGKEYYRFAIGEKIVCAWFDSPVVSRLIDQKGKQVSIYVVPQGKGYELTEVVSITKANPTPKPAVKAAPKAEAKPVEAKPVPVEAAKPAEPSPILDANNLPKGMKVGYCTIKKFAAMKTRGTPEKPARPYLIVTIADENDKAFDLFCWDTKVGAAVTKNLRKTAEIAYSSKPKGEDTLYTFEGFITIEGSPVDMYGNVVLGDQGITDDDLPTEAFNESEEA